MDSRALGKLTLMIPAVEDALLHINYLQQHLSKALHKMNQNQDTICSLLPTSLEELTWQEMFIKKKNGLPVQKTPIASPKIAIHVDALDSGWRIASEVITR